MQLHTPVDFPTLPFKLDHHQRYGFIGSCFADNISQQFRANKFNTFSNPFGVLYNPYSLAQCINDIVDLHFDESRMIEYDGLWHSFSHHGRFSASDKASVIADIKATIADAHQHLKNCNILFITLGTARVFEYQNQVVANCHKLPARVFERRRLSIDEIVNTFGESLKKLQALNPELQIIFTVSPVRYTKDGLYDNTLNKARLHLSIEEICKQNSHCFYLPIYETVIDEMRDYRYFAEDMTHPAPVAIQYLWEKISNNYFDSATQNLNKHIAKIIKAYHHRPLNNKPEAHLQFLKTMHQKASDLQKQHPELDLSSEIAYFSGK